MNHLKLEKNEINHYTVVKIINTQFIICQKILIFKLQIADVILIYDVVWFAPKASHILQLLRK